MLACRVCLIHCCLNFALHYNSNYWIGILPMVFWHPLPMEYWPPTDGISTPLPMVFWPPYPWNINPLPWYFDPLPMVFWPPYPWYINPTTNGIMVPLPMVYQPPYPWYFDLPAYLLIRNGGSKYHGGSIYHTGRGGQFSIRRFNIPWMKIDPGVNLPWGSKYYMTPGVKL